MMMVKVIKPLEIYSKRGIILIKDGRIDQRVK
jgi:hypothetical protein